MHKFRAVLLLCTISVVAVATVLWSSVSALRFYMPSEEATVAVPSVPSADDSILSENASSITPVSSAVSAGESAVPVIENNTVSGKIITKTVDPTSAALKYNGIYLKNTSGAAISIKDELAADFDLKLTDNSQPQVLIYHTHATESFMPEDRDYFTTEDASRSTDKKKNMVAVGEEITKKLQSAGISVLHDTTLHDYPSYSGSYTASAKTIKSYLEKYPSIKIIIDVHRDALGTSTEKTKLVKEIEGKTAAQVMLVMGSQTGVVTSYPNWKENLHLALRFQQTLENKYPGLARPMLLASKKYNQNLSTGAFLIEIGTDANTLDEALYSGELVGTALGEFLGTLK